MINRISFVISQIWDNTGSYIDLIVELCVFAVGPFQNAFDVLDLSTPLLRRPGKADFQLLDFFLQQLPFGVFLLLRWNTKNHERMDTEHRFFSEKILTTEFLAFITSASGRTAFFQLSELYVLPKLRYFRLKYLFNQMYKNLFARSLDATGSFNSNNYLIDMNFATKKVVTWPRFKSRSSSN